MLFDLRQGGCYTHGMVKIPSSKAGKIALLIGHPLGHSVSPPMHNAAYKKIHFKCEYFLLDVHPKDLKKALAELKAPHILGFNVTIPHKEAIIPYLDDITKFAQKVGAVNTVQNQKGKLVGFNTDAPGFIESLREDLEYEPKKKSCMILGAGGAGKAVCAALAENHAKKITIYDVDEEKAQKMAEYMNDLYECDIQAVEEEKLQFAIDKATLLVNASPIGMHPKTDATPLSKKIKLHRRHFVYDLVYNPTITKFMSYAKEQNVTKVCGGLGMLVRQGALAFTVFTGHLAPLPVMFKAAKEALGYHVWEHHHRQ